MQVQSFLVQSQNSFRENAARHTYTCIVHMFVLPLGAGSYDVILLDVDSKDTSTGMNCPPQQFLEDGFLGNMKLLLKHTGQPYSPFTGHG